MRFATLIALATLALVPVPAAPQEGRPSLEGKWKLLRIDCEGGSNLVGEVMTLADGNVTWTSQGGGTSSGGKYFIDPRATPPRMDINHGVGIYRMDADTLVVCWWADTAKIQNTFDVPKQNPRATVFTFRRVKD
jgi:uncharacterized protein (TIGR03067 family)